MEALAPSAIQRVFHLSAHDAAYRAAIYKFNQQQLDHQRKMQEKVYQQEQNEAFLDTVLTLATTDQIEAFQQKLDTYDTATVTALQENIEALDEIEDQSRPYLDNAFVTEDGRKVFKTRDNTKVYDEHGQELSHDDIDPSFISSTHTRWEAYQPLMQQRLDLLDERQELLDYQDKLDQARERLDDKDLTEHELKSMEQELDEMMPESVCAHVPGMEPKAAPANPENEMQNNLQAQQPNQTMTHRPTIAAPGMG